MNQQERIFIVIQICATVLYSGMIAVSGMAKSKTPEYLALFWISGGWTVLALIVLCIQIMKNSKPLDPLAKILLLLPYAGIDAILLLLSIRLYTHGERVILGCIPGAVVLFLLHAGLILYQCALHRMFDKAQPKELGFGLQPKEVVFGLQPKELGFGLQPKELGFGLQPKELSPQQFV